MKKILTYLFEQNNLNLDLAKSLLIDLSIGKFNTEQKAVLISIYNMLSLSLNEIEGFRQALLYLCLQLNLNAFNAIDIVGTGGDKNTFNISTLASFVVAGAGEKVIKHGNYASSSLTGSSNILEMLGCKFTTDINRLKNLLEKAGICFLHAPLFYPSIKKITSIRKNIGTKTFLNVLGPLLNPSDNQYKFIGVNNLELARIYYFFLQKTKKKYSIIHSLDGYDEISLTGQFKCYTNEGVYNYFPQFLGCLLVDPKDLKGGKSSEENKNIFLKIISGNGTIYQNEVVIVNAAFALELINKEDWRSNYNRAKESLESGKAKKSLKLFLDN
jgi:anthranilate phosphoribosyltransferase